MSLQFQEIEYCKDKVHFIAEPSLVAEKIQEAIKQCKKALISGYRPGKAPDFAIKLKLKEQIERWVKQELQVEAYNNYVFESKSKPIGFPIFKKSELHELEYWCEFVVLRKPSFVLGQYKGFEIPKPHQSQTSVEIVEHLLQELRQKYGEVVPYEEHDVVTYGDKVTLDRSCELDGKVLEGYRAEGELRTVDFNIEFDNNLLGMKVGECKNFTTSISNEVHNEEISGKLATWTVTIHAGLKSIPAPLDDTLAKKAGFENYEELYKSIEGSAVRKLQAVESQLGSQQLIKRILAAHDFAIPSWLTEMEAQHLALGMGAKWDQLPMKQKDIFLEQGSSNVKLALIMDSIREAEPEAFFTNQELLNILRQRLIDVGHDSEKFLVEAERDGRLLGMLEALRNEATLQWLITQSKIIE